MEQGGELKEEFLQGERVFSGLLIDVEHWRMRLPDGNTAEREIVLHRGAVAIVPLDEAGNVTLVRQHRPAIDRVTLEIPAGKLEKTDDDPLSAAVRELEEETGLRAARWQQLTDLCTTPGFCNEHIVIYLATGLSRYHSHTDEDEFLSAVTLPLEQAAEMVMRGEIRDGKTIAGLLMACRLRPVRDFPSAFAASSIQRNKPVFSSRPAENK